MEKNNRIPSALSVDVLKRALSPEQFEKLTSVYLKNKMTSGNLTRKDFLKKKLSDKDLEILLWYLSDDTTLNTEKEKEYGIPQASISQRAASIAVRVLFANRELIGELIEKYRKLNK